MNWPGKEAYGFGVDNPKKQDPPMAHLLKAREKMPQSGSTSVQLKVPYYDVDIMQIVWNGNYFKYFEVARQAFFKERGVDLLDHAKKTGYIFPVIRSMIKHIQPLRLDDEFVCTAILKEARIKIILKFEIKLLSNGLVCAKGQSEQVALLLPKMEMAFLIPEEIRKALFGINVST